MWQEIVAATPSHRGAMTDLRSGLQMGDDEWEVLQEVLQPDVRHECMNHCAYALGISGSRWEFKV